LAFVNETIFNFPSKSKHAKLPEDNAQLKIIKV
jgi:hypothetical protein